jgi:hypothetical protein
MPTNGPYPEVKQAKQNKTLHKQISSFEDFQLQLPMQSSCMLLTRHLSLKGNMLGMDPQPKNSGISAPIDLIISKFVRLAKPFCLM